MKKSIRDYDLYGDIVLEKRLGESIDIYKEAFTSEDFLGEIRKIWRERYHYVASTYKELITLYEMSIEKGLTFKDILPETKEYAYQGETRGTEQTFAVSLELYRLLSRSSDFLLNGENVYQISFRTEKVNCTYYGFEMRKIDIIRVK